MGYVLFNGIGHRGVCTYCRSVEHFNHQIADWPGFMVCLIPIMH